MAGKAFLRDGEFIRTNRAAQNWGRRLIGSRRTRYNQALVFAARAPGDEGGKCDVQTVPSNLMPYLVSLWRPLALAVP
jgi:hypothetical protein